MNHQCPFCGTQFEGNFCPSCGMRWQEDKTCPSCGARLSGNANFCNNCGYAFTQMPVARLTVQAAARPLTHIQTATAATATAEKLAKFVSVLPLILFSLFSALLFLFFLAPVAISPGTTIMGEAIPSTSFGNVYECLHGIMLSPSGNIGVESPAQLRGGMLALLAIAECTVLYACLWAFLRLALHQKTPLLDLIGGLFQLALLIIAAVITAKIAEFDGGMGLVQTGMAITLVLTFAIIYLVLAVIALAARYLMPKMSPALAAKAPRPESEKPVLPPSIKNPIAEITERTEIANDLRKLSWRKVWGGALFPLLVPFELAFLPFTIIILAVRHRKQKRRIARPSVACKNGNQRALAVFAVFLMIGALAATLLIPPAVVTSTRAGITQYFYENGYVEYIFDDESNSEANCYVTNGWSRHFAFQAFVLCDGYYDWLKEFAPAQYAAYAPTEASSPGSDHWFYGRYFWAYIQNEYWEESDGFYQFNPQANLIKESDSFKAEAFYDYLCKHEGQPVLNGEATTVDELFAFYRESGEFPAEFQALLDALYGNTMPDTEHLKSDFETYSSYFQTEWATANNSNAASYYQVRYKEELAEFFAARYPQGFMTQYRNSTQNPSLAGYRTALYDGIGEYIQYRLDLHKKEFENEPKLSMEEFGKQYEEEISERIPFASSIGIYMICIFFSAPTFLFALIDLIFILVTLGRAKKLRKLIYGRTTPPDPEKYTGPKGAEMREYLDTVKAVTQTTDAVPKNALGRYRYALARYRAGLPPKEPNGMVAFLLSHCGGLCFLYLLVGVGAVLLTVFLA